MEVLLSYTRKEGKQGQVHSAYTKRGKKGQYMQGGILSLHEKMGKQVQCKHGGILSPEEERGKTKTAYARRYTQPI